MLHFILSEIPEENGTSDDFSAYVPDGWSWVKISTEMVQCTLFTYSIMKIDNGEHCPVSQKNCTLHADGTLKYFVYGRHIDPKNTNLERMITHKEMIKDVLNKFKGMSICGGIRGNNIDVLPTGEVYQDYVNIRRSNFCSLLSTKKRCISCIKLARYTMQRAIRLKKCLQIKRTAAVSNPIDRRTVLALRKKIRRERCQKLRAKNSVKNLITCMQAQKDQIASIENVALDKKCSELNISHSQKLALTEIIAAAGKKDSRGQRYTEEWAMLCMLMNIRSPGYYEFLRKNNILPLPCKKTIRGYFSLINAKCGFDEQFAKLLEKHFSSKTPLQRHGVLLLDEINLRKSVAVCSRNLTYVGLTDMGDDGKQSTDIKDQATHGLVLMFQPLADTYTQPIAVFASKNPVNGEELAKIVLKAIPYLEQCGAIVHGVIADGAATNAKMWSLLGIKGTMENTKTFFIHPMDDKRKVFVFSDTCHAFKNIRNRLYNKRKLRVSYDNLS